MYSYEVAQKDPKSADVVSGVNSENSKLECSLNRLML